MGFLKKTPPQVSSPVSPSPAQNVTFKMPPASTNPMGPLITRNKSHAARENSNTSLDRRGSSTNNPAAAREAKDLNVAPPTPRQRKQLVDIPKDTGDLFLTRINNLANNKPTRSRMSTEMAGFVVAHSRLSVETRTLGNSRVEVNSPLAQPARASTNPGSNNTRIPRLPGVVKPTKNASQERLRVASHSTAAQTHHAHPLISPSSSHVAGQYRFDPRLTVSHMSRATDPSGGILSPRSPRTTDPEITSPRRPPTLRRSRSDVPPAPQVPMDKVSENQQEGAGGPNPPAPAQDVASPVLGPLPVHTRETQSAGLPRRKKSDSDPGAVPALANAKRSGFWSAFFLRKVKPAPSPAMSAPSPASLEDPSSRSAKGKGRGWSRHAGGQAAGQQPRTSSGLAACFGFRPSRVSPPLDPVQPHG